MGLFGLDFTDLAAIGTAAGAFLGPNAAGDAADAQVAAANAASSEQARQFNLTRADLAPFREEGVNALREFSANVLGPLEATPAFNFALNTGVNALERSAAARGKLLSGQQVKAVQQFGTDLARSHAGDQLNRQAALAGIGQTATTATGQFGADAARLSGNALLLGGDARASGFVGQNNAITDSINNLLQLHALQNR